MNQKLYSEYLDAKIEAYSKRMDFTYAIETWFDKHNIHLASVGLTPEDQLIDVVTIKTTGEFKKVLGDFENEFNLKCTRIFHNRSIIPNEDINESWKFHFHEKR